MTALGIDHVNLLTEDLAATVAFYEDVLGLVNDPSVLAGIGMAGTWLRDPEGRAIIHVVVKDGTRARPEPVEGRRATVRGRATPLTSGRLRLDKLRVSGVGSGLRHGTEALALSRS